MTPPRSVHAFRDEQLQHDPEFRAYWERTALARAVALRLVEYRAMHELSQTALAKRLGMQQPAIARLELGEHNPGVETLRKLSEVLGLEFLLHIAPTDRPPRWPDPPAEEGVIVATVRSEHSSVLAAAN